MPKSKKSIVKKAIKDSLKHENAESPSKEKVEPASEDSFVGKYKNLTKK